MRVKPIVIAAGLGLMCLAVFLGQGEPAARPGIVGIEVALGSERGPVGGVAKVAGSGGLRGKLERRGVLDAIEAFRLWSDGGEGDVVSGVELAEKRRVAMKWLIRNDPEAALERAIGYGERKRLRAEVVALLEEPVADGAAFEWLMACPLEDGSGDGAGESRWVTLEEDGRRLQAFVSGRRLRVGSKDRMSVHGVVLDGLMAVAEHPVRRMSGEEAADVFGATGGGVGGEVFGEPVVFASEGEAEAEGARLEAAEDVAGPVVSESPWTEGEKRILYIRVRFSDDAVDAEPLSFESADSRQNDVEEFFRLTSYGKVSVETEITDVVTLPDTHGSYSGQGLGRMMNDARAGAIVLGDASGKDWDYEGYDFYTVVSRGGIGGYAGIAQVGGRKAHLQSTSLRTAGHEYGHNFGLGHAYYNYTTALRPTGQSAFNGERPLVEYGHRFSIQSAQSGGDFNNPALPQFTVHEKNRLDWLADDDYADITGSAGAGMYRVYRNDHIDATGVQALRLPARSEGTNNRRYWISYRAAWAPPVRSSENAYLTNGVVIDWTRDSGSYSTLLDLTPYSDDGSHRSSSAWTRDNDDKWDAALLIGRTFSDLEAGVHVTPVGRGGSSPGEYLDVYVHVDGEREEVWVAETAACRAVVPDADTAVGLEWTAVGFDDSGWPAEGTLGVGYENRSGYRGFIGTDVGATMSGVRESCYVRVPFEVADPAALVGLGGLTLRLRYDDGFIAYLNGVKIAEANAPASPEWSSGATDGHSDSVADDFVEFVVGAAGAAALRAGANVLAIHGLNDGLGSSDFLIQPQLVASFPTEVNRGPAVELVADRGIAARTDEVVFTAAATDPDGDELAYAWHFGEGDAFAGEGLNSATAAKAWGSDGEYVVQVTVSDRRGGVARDQVVVKIGDVGSAAGQVRGRVLAGGLPVAGVRVWSGDVQTFSAGDGSYVLGGLGAGEHEVRAMADGEVFGATVGMPVVVDGVLSGVDFWAFGSDSNLVGGAVLTVSPAEAEVATGEVVPLAASWWTGDAGEEVLVGSAAGVWRFLDDGSDQGVAWRAVGFDDSSWASGAAPLGYGESGLGTEVGFGGDVSNRHTTTYFRRDAVVTGANGLSRAMLRVRRDDAVVVYVNGSEVMRDNIRPNDSVTASREAFNEVDGGRESEVLVVDVPVELLVEGTNVIAAEVHQESGDSSDLYFDLELVGRRNVAAAEGVVWSVEPVSGASVSAAGEFEATAAGVYVVTATVDGQAVTTRMVVASDVEVSVVAVDDVAMEWDTSGGLVRVERSDASGVLEVELAIGGSAEAGGDYVGLPASVIFADGETVVELPVVAVDDAEAEGFETVVVGVVADGRFRVGATGVAAVWIEDDDADPAPLVTITEPVVEAGASVELEVGQAAALMASVVDADVLVARGSGWRFLDLGQPAPEGWVEGGFADAGWGEGLAKFGYGDGDETTTVDFGGDSRAKYITTYFRKRFEVEQVAEIGVLTARMLVDDGAVVYLNGVEVVRQNMPGGEIGSTTRARSSVGGAQESEYTEFDLPVGVLLEGVNVIAVEVHQNSSTSSDLGFDLELEGERSGVVAGVVLEWVVAGGVVGDGNAYATEVVFGEAGTVVLRVTADDGGGGEGVDEVTFEVSGVSYASWIAGYGLPIDVQGERADADGDGVENLVEFALGMDGAAVDSGVPVESVPGGDWQVRFVRLRGGVGEVGDYAAAGVRYRLLVSDDGVSWVVGGEALALIGSEDTGDGYERVTVEVDAGAIGFTGKGVLFRIEISN